MKIVAEQNGVRVEVDHHQFGWSVCHEGNGMIGSSYFHPTRQAAEYVALHAIGSPIWRAAADKAYAQAEAEWRKEHPTLESVGATLV